MSQRDREREGENNIYHFSRLKFVIDHIRLNANISMWIFHSNHLSYCVLYITFIQNLQFHGVMRFYFQDRGQKVATKCIRVASDATVTDVIGML